MSTIAKPLFCSRKRVLICKSVQLVKTQHHCDGLAAKRPATAWMCTPGRCSWALFKDSLRPNRFSLHSGDLKSFLFWRLSIRYPSCIFHSCYLLLHFPLPHFPPLLSTPAFSTPAFSTPAFSAPPSGILTRLLACYVRGIVSWSMNPPPYSVPGMPVM